MFQKTIIPFSLLMTCFHQMMAVPSKNAMILFHALDFVPECYITQPKCDKAVDTYPSTIKCFMTQKMCDKAINNHIFFLFNSIPDRYKTQKMCDRAVSDYPLIII